MKRRVCQWQSVMLETTLNVHISRCENHECRHHLGPVNEEICITCTRRNPIGDEDEVANSMADEVYNVEVNKQSEKILAHLFDKHCADCPPEQGKK